MGGKKKNKKKLTRHFHQEIDLEKKKKKPFKPESVVRDLPVKAERSVSCSDPRAACLSPRLDSNAGKKKPKKKPDAENKLISLIQILAKGLRIQPE